MDSHGQPQYTQEIRYAVVMYGGISLAIYMNGIAQEMLRLVRATSADPESLSGTETIYRDIACLLHLGRSPGDGKSTNAPRTRFVIDILSGSSAGGINAVFLAKALAQKSKDLNYLRDLWLSKADVDTLLNDEKSTDGGRFRVSSPRKSLFNSGRMYGIIRDALDGMDSPEKIDPSSLDAADTIDLYVTATDLNGRVVPVELTDKALLERVHRSVFHFRHDPDESAGDFKPCNNAMLAFAARCTSSFPGAFEPVQFEKIVPQPTQEEAKEFSRFFANYTAPGEESGAPIGDMPYEKRVFADGGYLDNRPFGYVIDRIGERTSLCCPAFRRLVFIDPFPEHLEHRQVRTDFDFLENAMLAATTLPRYETIREDIARINSANRCSLRASEIEKTLFDLYPTGEELIPRQMKLGKDYGKMYINELLSKFGPLFTSDQLIKVSAVTDWLALVATRQLGFDESSDYYRIVRLVVRAWRLDTYSLTAADSGKKDKPSVTDFIFRYDLAFRLSRLRHLVHMIDRVSAYDPDRFKVFVKHLTHSGLLMESNLRDFSEKLFLESLAEFRKDEAHLLAELYKKKKKLEARKRFTMRPGADCTANEQEWFTILEEIWSKVDAIRLRFKDANLLELLDLVEEKEQQEYAQEIYENTAQDLREYFAAFARLLSIMRDEANGERKRLELHSNSKCVSTSIAANWLIRLWDSYEFVGNVMEKVLPRGPVGESGAVEIFRIGPADTNLTIRDKGNEKEKKLAGGKLGAFGAFLSEGWRENDILWGRLDGAERLIVSLLPDPRDKDLRLKYIEDAQKAILEEEFSLSNGRLYRWLAGQVIKYCGPGRSETEIRAYVEAFRSGCLKPVLDILKKDPISWQSFLTAYYDIPPGPDRKHQADWIARAVRIGGEMIEGIRPVKGIGTKLKILGIALYEMIQVAIPGSYKGHWFNYIIRLAMLVGLSLILLGALFTPDFTKVGVKFLLYAGGLWVIIYCLRSWLSRGSFPKWVKVLGLIVVGAAISAMFIYAVVECQESWTTIREFIKKVID